MDLATVGQAGQRVVHDFVAELVLCVFALADLPAQLQGALGHAFLQLQVGLLLELGTAPAVQAVGDLRGDEAEQLLVGMAVHHGRVVALHRDQPERPLVQQQRHAEPDLAVPAHVQQGHEDHQAHQVHLADQRAVVRGLRVIGL